MLVVIAETITQFLVRYEDLKSYYGIKQIKVEILATPGSPLWRALGGRSSYCEISALKVSITTLTL